MPEENVVFKQQGNVLIIQLNRPEKKNALTASMYRAITSVLQEAREDDNIRSVLITGQSDCFCAGNDIEDFLNQSEDDAPEPMKMLLQLVNFDKPLVAAVGGNAVGIGVTLLLHCDLVYVAEDTRLCMPFINLAVVPEAGSTLLLPNIMGHHRASELLLLGEVFDGVKARDYGIANESLPADQVFDHALKKARRIAAQPAESVRLTKQLLRKTEQDGVEHRMGEEGMIFAKRLKSDECRKLMETFMNSRG